MVVANIYRARFLLDGQYIKQDKGTTWVAVPDKYAGRTITVEYRGMRMTIKDWKKEAVMFRRFRDKYWEAGSNRSQYYTLGYFKWTPEV